MKKLHLFLLPIVCLLCFASCEDTDSSPRGLLNLILVDSPAHWDSVFVEINGVNVEVLAEGRDTQSQTFFFEYKNGDKRIKVSDLVAGNALLLGRNELPVGQVIKTTILLGDNHSMYLDEKEYPLPLEDDASFEMVLESPLEIENGFSYDILLDIDLEKSIIQTSESPLSYELNPFFTLIKGAGTVDISGVLEPISLYPAIYLSTDQDTLTTHTDESGNYYFRVPPGSYRIYFDPKDEQYEDISFTLDMTISTDSVLEDVTFQLKP
ncbi:DUF4382 domain-containing protein [Algoriphagus chordae]|uniref:Uncharacterized protein DUF4382 n=1 Tax=Algoriphagus chordae TaxID=237019 RepID=A0A2W7RTM2_9BACT|nr:DUF4382 domain-containing protein [Algoriphagus chordae]PZX57939.1 uncharacterized protein DUF4382 [Algoriphagus chordae]